MRTKITDTVNFFGMQMPVMAFLNLWVTLGSRKLEILPFKRDLRYWNNGPTAMQPKKMIACMQYDRHEEAYHCVGVYEIWERTDGFGTEVYRFDTMEDYNNYNPSNESPSAFAQEIGMK